jgi:MFS family permease
MSLSSVAVGGSASWTDWGRATTENDHAERRERPLRNDLQATLSDGVTCSLMIGMGESYLPAFVLALGMGEIAAGLITTIPLLLGAVLQTATPWAVQRLRSRRRWVVACSRCQAASLLLLLVLPFVGAHWSWLVFVAASLYWGSGLAAGPVWNTWMEAVIPTRIRARFFAARVRLNQAAVMAAFMFGGLVLHLSSGSAAAIWAFATLFALAALSRFSSAAFLASQSEPESGWDVDSDMGLMQTVQRLRDSADTRLLAYLVVVQIAVYTSAPYFTPFMLKELHLTYLHYMALIALGFFGKLLMLPAWGRLAARAGAGRLLWIGGLGIVPVSAFWLVSQSFWYLAVVQVVSGGLWAAYELAMALLFVEAIPKRQRTSLLTIYNLGNSTAMVVGGLLGAALLASRGGGFTTYLILFGLSSVARAATIVLLARVPVTLTRKTRHGTLTVEAQRPAGTLEEPTLASLPRRTVTARPTAVACAKRALKTVALRPSVTASAGTPACESTQCGSESWLHDGVPALDVVVVTDAKRDRASLAHPTTKAE